MLKSVLQIVSSRFFSSGLSFIWSIFAIRILAPEVLADYAWIMAVLPILLLVSDLGVKNSLLKALPLIQSRNREEKVLRIVQTVSRLKIWLLFLTIFILIVFGLAGIFQSRTIPLALGILLFSHTFYYFLETILQAQEDFRTVALSRVFIQILRLVGIIFIWNYPLFKTLVIVEIISYLLIAIYLKIARKDISLQLNYLYPKQSELKEIFHDLKTGFWLFVAEFAGVLIKRFDIILITIFCQPFQVAKYVAASKLAVPVNIILQSITYTLLPTAFKTNRNSIIRNKSLVVWWILIWLVVLIIICFLPVNYNLLNELLYGGKYPEIKEIVKLVILGIVVAILYQPLILILHNFRKSKTVAGIYLFMLPVYIGLANYIIPVEGALGASKALLITRSTLAIFVMVTLLIIFYNKPNKIEARNNND